MGLAPLFFFKPNYPKMELDARMLLRVAISALVMAVVFHFQARSFPLSIKGIRQWSATFAMLGVALLTMTCRGWLPELFTIVLSSLLVQASLVVFYRGMCEFQGDRPNYRWVVAPIALNVVSLLYFLYADTTLWARVAVNSLSNAVLTLPLLILVLKGRQGDPKIRFSKIYTAIFLTAILGIWVFRGTFALVFKPLLPPEITPAVHQVLIIFYPTVVMVFATGLVLMAFDRLKDELEYLVSHDVLTGAFSRRGFLSLAESEISRALRMQRNIALMVLDLDYFKEVNDRFGQPAGDLVLRKFADMTKSCLRREDLFGRFGGEEFMVLLPDTTPEASLVVAERIRTAVSASRVMVPSSQNQIRFTVSIGIANAAGRGTLDELLKLADGAMYLAKSRGRNRVEVAL